MEEKRAQSRRRQTINSQNKKTAEAVFLSYFDRKSYFFFAFGFGKSVIVPS